MPLSVTQGDSVHKILLALIGCLSVSSAFAQSPDLPDPTAESPAIKERMDAVRGMENLKALKSEMEELAQQNQSLRDQLVAMQQLTEALREELQSIKQDRELKDQQRRNVPEMRLVAQVRTSRGRTAEIQAGERLYRLISGQPFRLYLGDGQAVVAKPEFQDDGTIEISLPDLNVSHLLMFRPSPPDPEASRRREREREDG
ncbi:MAG: hypothetical protein AAFU85_28615 [Planctomycetota bacterium]